MERIVECAFYIAQCSGQQTYDRVCHHGRRHLSSGENEIADGVLFGDEMIAHALIYAFVMTAKDDDILFERKGVSGLLVKAFSVWCGEDDLIVVAFGFKMGDEAINGFYLQYHTGTEPESIIVHFTMFIQRPIT